MRLIPLLTRGYDNRGDAEFAESFDLRNMRHTARSDILDVNRTAEAIIGIETILPIHKAQTLTYMRLGGWHVGLILNFNVTVLKNGIKRLVHKLKE